MTYYHSQPQREVSHPQYVPCNICLIYRQSFLEAPSAPPSNFTVNVINTMVCLSWDLPPEDGWNGVIISYTLTCSSNDDNYSHVVKQHVTNFCLDLRLGNLEFTCSVLASTAVGNGPPTDLVTVTTEGNCFSLKITICCLKVQNNSL